MPPTRGAPLLSFMRIVVIQRILAFQLPQIQSHTGELSLANLRLVPQTFVILVPGRGSMCFSECGGKRTRGTGRHTLYSSSTVNNG